MRLSPHFDSEEFRCHDGSYKDPDPELVRKLELLRTELGNTAIHINSAYRSPAYNRKVGGSPKSQHLLAKAADIVVKGKTPKEVATAAAKVGFTGIGTYKKFTHVDVRPKPARWNG